MWMLYNQAKRWSTRPSDLLAIESPYTALCLDQAVAYFGDQVSAALERVDGKTAKDIESKRYSLLLKYLGAPDEQRFASVAGLGKRK